MELMAVAIVVGGLDEGRGALEPLEGRDRIGRGADASPSEVGPGQGAQGSGGVPALQELVGHPQCFLIPAEHAQHPAAAEGGLSPPPQPVPRGQSPPLLGGRESPRGVALEGSGEADRGVSEPELRVEIDGPAGKGFPPLDLAPVEHRVQGCGGDHRRPARWRIRGPGDQVLQELACARPHRRIEGEVGDRGHQLRHEVEVSRRRTPSAPPRGSRPLGRGSDGERSAHRPSKLPATTCGTGRGSGGHAELGSPRTGPRRRGVDGHRRGSSRASGTALARGCARPATGRQATTAGSARQPRRHRRWRSRRHRGR